MTAMPLIALLPLLAQQPAPAASAEPQLFWIFATRDYDPNRGLPEGGEGGRRPIVFGTPLRFSVFRETCRFSLNPPRSGGPGSGWEVGVTAKRGSGTEITAEVEWSPRPRVGGTPAGPSGRVTLTARPGDRFPLDLGSGTGQQSDCRQTASQFSLTLQDGPIGTTNINGDRRLVSTELWLFDKAPDGTEREAQRLSIRGTLNEPVPYFFDDLALADETLDVFGQMTPRLLPDGKIEMELKTSRRFSALADNGSGGVGSGAMTVVLSGSQTASVELPAILDEQSRVFKNHQLSIRMRSALVRTGAAGGPPKPPAPLTLRFTLRASITGQDGQALPSLTTSGDIQAAGGFTPPSLIGLSADGRQCDLSFSGSGAQAGTRPLISLRIAPLYEALGAAGVVFRVLSADPALQPPVPVDGAKLAMGRRTGESVTIASFAVKGACGVRNVVLTGSVTVAN